AADKTLDHVSKLVSSAVETEFRTIGSCRNDGLGTSVADPLPHCVTVVRLVGDHVIGFGSVQEDFGTSDVMPLPFRKMQFSGLTDFIHRNMDLGAETATRPSQCLSILPPFAPAACWCARTMVESSRRLESSVFPPSASSTCPQTPRLHQRLNRLYTVPHGPNRSGRSRQGEPVRAIQNTALMNNRLSPAVLPGSLFLPGRCGSIVAHCSSVTS